MNAIAELYEIARRESEAERMRLLDQWRAQHLLPLAGSYCLDRELRRYGDDELARIHEHYRKSVAFKMAEALLEKGLIEFSEVHREPWERPVRDYLIEMRADFVVLAPQDSRAYMEQKRKEQCSR